MPTVLKVWALASVGILSLAAAGCRSGHDDGHDHSTMRSAGPALVATR